MWRWYRSSIFFNVVFSSVDYTLNGSDISMHPEYDDDDSSMLKLVNVTMDSVSSNACTPIKNKKRLVDYLFVLESNFV